MRFGSNWKVGVVGFQGPSSVGTEQMQISTTENFEVGNIRFASICEKVRKRQRRHREKNLVLKFSENEKGRSSVSPPFDIPPKLWSVD